jgi:hypothetical protein
LFRFHGAAVEQGDRGISHTGARKGVGLSMSRAEDGRGSGKPLPLPMSTGQVSLQLTMMAMNTAFLCDVQYYNGPAVHRVDLLRWIGVDTVGFAFQSIMVTKILRMGFSVCEVPMYIQAKAGYRSSAVRLHNVISVVKSFVKLFFEIYSNPSLYPVPFLVRRVNLE